MQRRRGRAGAEANFDPESLRVRHVLLRVLEKSDDDLRQVAQLGRLLDHALGIPAERRIQPRPLDAQHVQQRVQMALAREVQPSPDSPSERVDREVRAVAQIDHVPHVDLVVGLRDDQVVLDLLEQLPAHLASDLPLLLQRDAVLLRDDAVRQQLRELVQLHERVTQAEVRVVEHVEPHIIVDVGNLRQVERVGLLAVQLGVQQAPPLRELEQGLALVELDAAQRLVAGLLAHDALPVLVCVLLAAALLPEHLVELYEQIPDELVQLVEPRLRVLQLLQRGHQAAIHRRHADVLQSLVAELLRAEVHVCLELLVDGLLAYLQRLLHLLVAAGIKHVHAVLLLVNQADENRRQLALELEHPLREGCGGLHYSPLVTRLDLEVVPERRVQAKDPSSARVGVRFVPEALPEVDRLLLPELREVAAPLQDEH